MIMAQKCEVGNTYRRLGAYETAKANGLKPYDYFQYLLTEIPKHLEDKDCGFLEDLLP